MSEGIEVKADDHFVYFRAVARNALLEYWKVAGGKDMPSMICHYLRNLPSILDELDLQQTMQNERARG